jgi:hypothetical protein
MVSTFCPVDTLPRRVYVNAVGPKYSEGLGRAWLSCSSLSLALTL